MSDCEPAHAPYFVERDLNQFSTEQEQRTAVDLADLLRLSARAEACLVCGVLQGQDQLRLLAARGIAMPQECACDRPSDAGLAEALAGRWHRSTTSAAEPQAAPCPGVAELAPAERLVLPLSWQGHAVGVVQIFRRHSEGYSDEEVQQLLGQGQAVAVALENARLYDRAQVLFYLAQTVSSTLDMEHIGDLIAEKVSKAVGTKGCTVRSLDRLSNQLQLVGAYGLSHQYLFEKGPVIASTSIRDALDGKPTQIFDVANDERAQYPAAAILEGIGSIASIPMVVKGVVTGVLRVYTARPYEFSPDEMAFLCAAAGVAAAAVENARLYDGIRHDFDTLMDEIVFVRRASRSSGGSREAGV
ncbi:MAG: GAF domain-containing protein [Chloroflexi bacterium]|nr:GAF domain-containing protein [Chloroflexota bacterium]MCL5107738.1 GAF domain-containing protein [Chloroflexota bacterium]